MDRTKSPILILIVLILVSLALAGGLFRLLRKEKATEKAANLTLQKERAESDKKLKEAQLRIDALASELKVEKGGKEEALKQVEQLKADITKQNELKTGLEVKVK